MAAGRFEGHGSLGIQSRQILVGRICIALQGSQEPKVASKGAFDELLLSWMCDVVGHQGYVA